ncbi:MAG: hypothetical protein OK457_02310, partial [Thaumarchaeota archaeon]|nr:hypothetical protein [Nitrososphaerota archaeon]
MEKIYIIKTSSVAFESSMNYKSDTTRLSVLVVTILLVGSSFAFLPAFAANGGARTNAVKISPTSNGAPPTVSGAPNIIIGANTTTVLHVIVSNPATNAYSITSITVLAPSGWTFATGGPPVCGTNLATAGAFSSGAVQCTSGAGGGLPPGFSTNLALEALTGPGSAASSPPVAGTFTTLVVDASSTATYAGGSFTEWNIASTKISVNAIGTSFTAGGSPITVTATLGSAQAGVPIVWSFANATYPDPGFTASLSPSTSVTTASGASTTFTPSNDQSDATAVTATIGTALNSATTTSVQTQAGAPSKVSFYFTMGAVQYGTDYLTNSSSVGGVLYARTGAGTPAQEVTLSLSDAFANAVAFTGAITNITITGVGGKFYSAPNLYSTISCGTAAAGNSHFALATCQSGSSLTLPFNYLQSSVYGTVGELAGTIFQGVTQYTGSSGNLVTGTLSALGQTLPTSGTAVKAGSSVNVQESLALIGGLGQSGVPITLNLCKSPCATTAGYNAKFSNGLSTITLTTNSSGAVASSVAVNTTSGDIAYFNATAPAPVDSSTTKTIASAASASVTTSPGPISTLVVNIAASTGPNIKWIVNGSTAYVSVAYADAYNNLVTTAPTNQIQIGLVASVGALSATQVYIAAGDLATNSSAPVASFGAILWTLPSTVGTTATITASAN